MKCGLSLFFLSNKYVHMLHNLEDIFLFNLSQNNNPKFWSTWADKWQNTSWKITNSTQLYKYVTTSLHFSILLSFNFLNKKKFLKGTVNVIQVFPPFIKDMRNSQRYKIICAFTLKNQLSKLSWMKTFQVRKTMTSFIFYFDVLCYELSMALFEWRVA